MSRQKINSTAYNDEGGNGYQARQKTSGDRVQNKCADHRVRASHTNMSDIS